MMHFVPNENQKPKEEVLQFLRQFARQFRPVAVANC